MTEYHLQSASRKCSSTGRELAAGESFVSALIESGDRLERREFASTAWQELPEGCVAWWHCQVPEDQQSLPAATPREAMLKLFDRWRNSPAQADQTFVLALWLMRRKVLRCEEASLIDASGSKSNESNVLRLYCPSRNESYDVPVVYPTAQRQSQIQAELSVLLYGAVA
jgi:hypothetical protein